MNTGASTGGHLTTGGGREGEGLARDRCHSFFNGIETELNSLDYYETREINCLFSDRGRLCTLGHSVSYVSFVTQQCHPKYVAVQATPGLKTDRLFIISSSTFPAETESLQLTRTDRRRLTNCVAMNACAHASLQPKMSDRRL